MMRTIGQLLTIALAIAIALSIVLGFFAGLVAITKWMLGS